MNRSLHNRITKLEKALKPAKGLWRLFFYDSFEDIPEKSVALPVKSDDYQPPQWDFYSPIIEDDTQDTPQEAPQRLNNEVGESIESTQKPAHRPAQEVKRGVWIERLNMHGKIVSTSKL